MKTFFKSAATKVLAGLLAAGLLVMGVVPALADTAAVSVSAQAGKLVVSGQATVSVRPDIAYIYLGVETTDTTAAGAVSNNTAQMTDLVNALEDLGVANTDLQTYGYYMYPQYDYYSSDTPAVIGYYVSNNLMVTLRDVSQIGDLLTTAVSAGDNIIQNIAFDVSNPSQYYTQALSMAITDAQGKAKAMAGVLGVSIGKPSEVDENGYYYPSYYYYPEPNSGTIVTADNAQVEDAILTGRVQITAYVTATYNY